MCMKYKNKAFNKIQKKISIYPKTRIINKTHYNRYSPFFMYLKYFLVLIICLVLKKIIENNWLCLVKKTNFELCLEQYKHFNCLIKTRKWYTVIDWKSITYLHLYIVKLNMWKYKNVQIILTDNIQTLRKVKIFNLKNWVITC